MSFKRIVRSIVPRLQQMSRRPTTQRPWQAASLESRCMLAGDVGDAIAGEIGTSHPSAETTAGELALSIEQSCQSEAKQLLLLDGTLPSEAFESLQLPLNAELVLIQGDGDVVSQITRVLEGYSGLECVHIISHGKPGELHLAGQIIDQQTLHHRQHELTGWKDAFSNQASFRLYGCDVAATQKGQQFVRSFATLCRASVAASTDRTGNPETEASAVASSANWMLEFQAGKTASENLLVAGTLPGFKGHLGIEIVAAGQLDDEELQLQIGDQVIESWVLQKSDATSGQFQYLYAEVSGVDPDQVRLNFVNDLYQPENGIDRNIRVDKIIIDGVTYQAEDPSVFSTATWKPEDGQTPGFRQSELMTSNGYMAFSRNGAQATNESTTIEIDAAGDTGDETMQLIIDENVVRTFRVTQQLQTYTFDANVAIDASRIRVAMVDDLYLPGQGYDRNLTVDKIRVNGQVFESESPTTFVTGTHIDGVGITSGFLQTERIMADGYFQYEASDSNPGNPVDPEAGQFSLATANSNVLESAGSIEVEVKRIGGSKGVVSIDLFTADEQAVAGVDYVAVSQRLVFQDGETSKKVTVQLINDSIAEPTKAFSVRVDNPIGANLLAPRTALITIVDDDSNLPAFASFPNATDLKLNGGASVTGGELQLTSTGTRQAGSAFYNSPISVNDNTSFQTSFSFRISGGWGTGGADGFAFLLQNHAAGLSSLGNAGGYLGYDTIKNSVAIEFDTYKNGGDLYGNSIAVVLNGNTRSAVKEVAAPFDLNNGKQYFAWVDYNGDSNVLAVYLSDQAVKPLLASLRLDLDLAQVVGEKAYVGFSAGNYDQPNYHRISAWTFSLDVPDADPPVAPTGAITATNLYSGLNQPIAIEWSPDARNLYIAEKGGVIKVSRDGSTNLQTVLDISSMVNDVQDRGLLDIALHPDFLSNGYIYASFTYDPPEVYQHVGDANAGPDGRGNRASRVVRWQLDAATNFTTVVEGSETIIVGKNSNWQNINAFVDSTVDLNAPQAGYSAANGYLRDFINSDSRSHTIGSLAFDQTGMLLVSTGDGASFNQTDRRALRVQSLYSLSGKILRVDPLTGQGLSDNPFYDGDPDSNRSKIFQMGLRNPWRLTVDEASGRLYIGETGLSSFEEINTGAPGANFGWPYYEGGVGVNSPTPGYLNLPEAKDFYKNGRAVVPAIGIAHQAGSNVVVLGDIVHGTDLGVQYEGDLFYNDFYRGIVRHANVGADGKLSGVEVFTTGAQFVVEMKQGPDGSLYYVNLVTGVVGKWEIT